MTKQPSRHGSEGSRFSQQLSAGRITDADVQRVAAEGEIPKEQLPELREWLRYTVKNYYQFARMYDNCPTKRKKLKLITEINVAARRLNKPLKQPWPKAAMMSHEASSLLSRKEDLSDNRSAAIKEQVERDLSGVEALVSRTATMLKQLDKQLELRPQNADEKIVAAGRADPAVKILHNLMRGYWKRLGSKPTLAEESPYVKFVRAIYRVVGLDEEASFETIRSRDRAARR